MFTLKLMPRFAETDALGHINNTVLPVWFEQARTPIFKFFTPSLDVNNWQLILAKIEVEFVAEIFYGSEVEIRTSVEKVGTSSILIYQEVWQGSKQVVKGKATMVHFDHQKKKSKPIPNKIKALLNEHLSA